MTRIQQCPLCSTAMIGRPETFRPRPDRIIAGIKWSCKCGMGIFEFHEIREPLEEYRWRVPRPTNPTT